jgi:copper transport protein
MRLLRLIAAALLGLTLLLPAAAPVRAHAVLLLSNPADGSTNTNLPEVLTFTFSEPLVAEASGLDLIDPDGERIAAGIGTVSATDSMMMELRISDLPGLAFRPGVWTIVWRTLSTVDGHRWGGSIRVGVADVDGVVPGLDPGELSGSSAGIERPLTTIAIETQTRLLIVAGLLIAIGGALVAPLLLVPFARRSPRAIDLVAMGGIAAALIGAWFVFPAIGATHPTAGSIGAVAVAGIAEAALLRWMNQVAISRLAVAGAAGLGLLLWSNATHAAGAGPAAVAALVVHIAAIAAWTSGVALFAYALFVGPRTRALSLVLPRLSGLVLLVAPLVALSGGLLSLALLRSPAGLFSLYGVLLGAKVLLVLAAGLLGLRSLLGRRNGRGEAVTTRTTRELAAFAGAALLAALIATTPTPTSGFAASLAPVRDVIDDGTTPRLALGVAVTPARPGPNRFEVSGLPDGAQAELLFTRLDDTGDLRLVIGAGSEIADVGVLPSGSRWTITIVVRDDDGTPIDTRAFRLEIGSRRITAGSSGLDLPVLGGLLVALGGLGALLAAGRPGQRGLRLPAPFARRLRGRLDPRTAPLGARLAGAAALGLGLVTVIAELILR